MARDALSQSDFDTGSRLDNIVARRLFGDRKCDLLETNAGTPRG